MPFRSASLLSRAAHPLSFTSCSRGVFRASRCCRPLPPTYTFASGCRSLHEEVVKRNHYERLNVGHNATAAEIKKSFYKLSKAHHPDANPTDPSASDTFSLLSESYTVLSDPTRRAAYDREVLRLQSSHHSSSTHPHSYHSTASNNPAGGRSPSGLSRRRGSFRGPPPSFYKSGGWGAHSEKRRRAHDESTGGAAYGSSTTGSSSKTNTARGEEEEPSSSSTSRARHAGMGPGADPFAHRFDDDIWHFDKQGHDRTQKREDRRRWERGKRAVGDDDVEFEPQMSPGGHFVVVLGILGVSFIVPMLYLQFKRSGRKYKEGKTLI